MDVEHEVKLLVQEMKRLGSPNADGQISVKFGVLFSDDRCANIFEGKQCVKHANSGMGDLKIISKMCISLAQTTIFLSLFF